MAFDDKSSKSPDAARREALRALGGSALSVLAGSVLAGTASAQIQTRPEISTAIRQGATLNKLNAAQINALQLTRRMPESTPITKLGLTPEGVSKLSPAAKGLTKKDLELLGRGDTRVPALSKLTVSDIASIRDAFGVYYRPAGGIGGLAALDVSCCCCTPCCCAAAVSEPLALAA